MPSPLFCEKSPTWSELGVELVFECTGALTRREDLEKHIRAGARFVLLSAPSKDEEVETVVHGVNAPRGTSAIISCASCTTNCITPIVEIIGRRIGVEKAVMTTVHAYTASQSVVDGPDKRFRRGRAAAANLVPATTGGAVATTRALPEYAGRFDGVAIRAPVPIGSIADITSSYRIGGTSDEPRTPRLATGQRGCGRQDGRLPSRRHQSRHGVPRDAGCRERKAHRAR